VIFSVPVGGPLDEPRLHLVSLSASKIDWAKTDRYAVSARYDQYARTRGEADFIELSNEVARVLTRPDIKEKLFGLGTDVVASSPERLAAVMKSDMARMSKVISSAKITLER